MDSRVLFVSPHREDARTVSRMLEPALIQLDHVASFQEARERLGRETFHAVLTEACLPDGNWTDVLDLALDIRTPPAVIVTHRAADDRFWAEVLNLGCYDMLAQPFDAREVQRILTLACAQVPVKLPASAGPVLKSLSAAL